MRNRDGSVTSRSKRPTPEEERAKPKAIVDEDELAEVTPNRAKCRRAWVQRLRAESRAVKVLDRNITSLSALTVDDIRAFLGNNIESALSPAHSKSRVRFCARSPRAGLPR